jgi:hypothetical protein
MVAPTYKDPYIHKQVKVVTSSILGIQPENVISFESRIEQLGGSFSVVVPQTDHNGNPVIIPYDINDFVPSVAIVNGLNIQGFIDDITESIGSQGILYRIDGTVLPRGAREYRPRGFFSNDQPFIILGLSRQKSLNHPVNLNYKPFDSEFKGFEIIEEPSLTFKRVVQLLCDLHNIPVSFDPDPIDFKIHKYYYSGENVLNAIEELCHYAGANAVLNLTTSNIVLRIIPWNSAAAGSYNALREDSLSDFSITRDKPNYTHLVIQPSTEMTPLNSNYFGPLEKVFDISLSMGPTAINDATGGTGWSVPSDNVDMFLSTTSIYTSPPIKLTKNETVASRIKELTGQPAVWAYRIREYRYQPSTFEVALVVDMVTEFSSIFYNVPYSDKDYSHIMYITREKDRQFIKNLDDLQNAGDQAEFYTESVTRRLNSAALENLTSDRSVQDITNYYIPDILEPIYAEDANLVQKRTPGSFSRVAFAVVARNVSDIPDDYLTAVPEDGIAITVDPQDYTGQFRILLAFTGAVPYFVFREPEFIYSVASKIGVFRRTAAMGTAKFTKGSPVVELKAGIAFGDSSARQAVGLTKFKSFHAYLVQHIWQRFVVNTIKLDSGITEAQGILPDNIDYYQRAIILQETSFATQSELNKYLNNVAAENAALSIQTGPRAGKPISGEPDKFDVDTAYILTDGPSPVDYEGSYSLGPRISYSDQTAYPQRIPSSIGAKTILSSGLPGSNIQPVTAEYSFYAFPRRIISGAYTIEVGQPIGYMSWETTPYSDTKTITHPDLSTSPYFNPKRLQSNLIVDYVFSGNNAPLSRHLYNFASKLSLYMATTYYKYSYRTYVDPDKVIPNLGSEISIEGTSRASVVALDISISNSDGAILVINAGRFPIP